MPVLSRRTRRLLKLLLVPNWGSKWEKLIMFVIPLIAMAVVIGFGVYLAYAEDGEYRNYAWFPLVYLWVHKSFLTMEEDNKKTRNAVRALRRDFARIKYKLDGGKIKVDVIDFAARAREFTNEQVARHRRRT